MRHRSLWLLRPVFLGLATTILSAWAIALIRPEGHFTCTGASFPQPAAVVSIAGPAHRIDAIFRGLDNDPLILSPPLGNYRGFTFIGGASWSGSASSHSGFLLNGGDRSSEPTSLTLAPETEIIAARSCGWPLLCLESRASRTARGWSSSWQLHLAGPEPRSGSVFAATLPLRPLWPGFLLNTLAFTATWAALLSTPAALRRIRSAIRARRKGRCPNCGYDLKGLPGPTCPECGVANRVS